MMYGNRKACVVKAEVWHEGCQDSVLTSAPNTACEPGTCPAALCLAVGNPFLGSICVGNRDCC